MYNVHNMPGVLRFSMSGPFFMTKEEVATSGKFFCLRLLEELHKMGYDLQISAASTQARLAADTLFFRKVTCERPKAKVVCIAPWKQDTIILLNHNESVKREVENAIMDAWPSGIQRQKDEEVSGHTVHVIKMRILGRHLRQTSKTSESST